MAGYIGSKAVNLSTTGADIAGDADVSGALDVGGGLTVDNDGATVLTVNRATSDGSIVDFKKDGTTTVGSIGYVSTGLYIDGEASHSGFRFGGLDVTPRRNGADVDATVQLGTSINRFTDLYLSGGIYLGGVGAANKLDDYEEGEWTYSLPCVGGGSFTPRTNYLKGFYTKIGRLVTIHLRYETLGSSSPSGDIQLAGLPFNVDTTAPTNGSASYTYPILLRGASNSSYEWDYSFHIGLIPGTTTGKFYGQGDGSSHSYRAIQATDISSNFEGSICLTYKTNQ